MPRWKISTLYTAHCGSHAQQKKENGGCFGGSFVLGVLKAMSEPEGKTLEPLLAAMVHELWSVSETLPRAGNRRQAFICQLLPPESSHSSASYFSVQKFDTGPVTINIFKIIMPVGLHVFSCYFLIGWAMKCALSCVVDLFTSLISQLVPTATDHNWTCPTGTHWRQCNSTRHDWMFTLDQLSVNNGWRKGLSWVTYM